MEQRAIEKDFVQNTLHILQNYHGPYGVTLLVNCLLGLIVLPREKDYNHISEKESVHFNDLGIEDEDIRSWGEGERTAARFIKCMRNSIAHIQIESITKDGEIESLLFTDNSGFEAVLCIDKIKDIVKRLAAYIQ
jgi:hypothetical protein